MYPDKYQYISILTFENDGISIEFPDFPSCLSCAETVDEAISSAKEALCLHLYGMECDKETIPAPTKLENIKLEANQTTVILDIFMVPFREKMNSKFVKKTLSIPNWLNTLAEHEQINFSKVLQKALIDYLQIDNM